MIDRKIADFVGAKVEEKGETGNQDEDDDEELPPIISAKQEREAGGIFFVVSGTAKRSESWLP
jgi:hypothetical protein